MAMLSFSSFCCQHFGAGVTIVRLLELSDCPRTLGRSLNSADGERVGHVLERGDDVVSDRLVPCGRWADSPLEPGSQVVDHDRGAWLGQPSSVRDVRLHARVVVAPVDEDEIETLRWSGCLEGWDRVRGVSVDQVMAIRVTGVDELLRRLDGGLGVDFEGGDLHGGRAFQEGDAREADIETYLGYGAGLPGPRQIHEIEDLGQAADSVVQRVSGTLCTPEYALHERVDT